jgi:nitroreductase
MELIDTLRTTGAVREFKADPVPDHVLWRVLDTARFAPSGGNAQTWRVVVVKDAESRRRLRDLYLPAWYDYLAMSSAGLRPWAPPNDRAAEVQAMKGAAEVAADAARGKGGFAEHLDEVPVLLALFADLKGIAAVDRDMDRYSFAGGASVYPFAWNLLLAAREEGLGGVMTTMAVRREDEVRELLDAPDDMALAALLALGYPERQASRLARSPVESFTTIDSLSGPPLRAPEGTA